MFKKICHRFCSAGFMALQTVTDLWVMTDYSCWPLFVPQAEHLLAGVAQGAVADVMEQSCAVEQPAMLLKIWLQRQHALKSTSCQMENPKGVGEPT